MLRAIGSLLGRTAGSIGPRAIPNATAGLPTLFPSVAARSPVRLFNSTSVSLAYVEKLKSYKPTSPGFRHRKIVDTKHLWRGKPFKKLTVGLRKSGGRNHVGHITVWQRGGGHKRRYRIIDFIRAGENTVKVERLEYDPNRTAWIALVKDVKTEKYSYYLCPKNISEGDVLQSGEHVDAKDGFCMPLKNMPVGSMIHNIEIRPGQGGQIARAAGAFAQLLKTSQHGLATIRLSSGETRHISVHCRATLGVVSNTLHKSQYLGKAGASRWKGRRPHVRGTAMNPVDHPHGGGQGKTSGGRPSVTPWGVYTKGKPTRNNKKTDKYIIVSRRRALGRFNT